MYSYHIAYHDDVVVITIVHIHTNHPNYYQFESFVGEIVIYYEDLNNFIEIKKHERHRYINLSFVKGMSCKTKEMYVSIFENIDDVFYIVRKAIFEAKTYLKMKNNLGANLNLTL